MYEEQLILDNLDQKDKMNLAISYLDECNNFKMPLSAEGCNYLKSLGILEVVTTKRNWYD